MDTKQELEINHGNSQLTDARRMQIMFAVGIGTFMGPLDSSVVNIALPAISEYYHASLGVVEWVIMSYLLMISSLLLTYGRLGDMYGHKRIYTIGFIIFTLGSLFCALAWSITLLIVFRGIQAIGAGMMMAMGSAIVTDIAPPKERGKYMGIIAVSVSVALVVGPVLGGILTTFFGWQSIFYINLPIGIIGYVWAKKVVPDFRKAGEQIFDIKGAFTLFVSLTSILLSLSFAEKAGWSNLYVLSLLLVGILLLFLFAYIEKRSKEPMVDLSIFQNRIFLMGNVSSLLNFIAMFSVILLMPFYLQQLRMLSPSQAGLMFIPMPLTSLIVAPLSGILSDRVDARYISSLGMGITATGLLLLSFLHAESSNLAILSAMFVIGLGTGMFNTPNNSSVMGSVAKNRLGIASSMLAMMRNMGMVLGVAISGAIFNSRYHFLHHILSDQGLLGEELRKEVFVGALNLSFKFAAIIAFIAVFTSLIRGSIKNQN